MSLHRLAEIDGTRDIVLIIGQRFGNAFPHRFQSRKVDHRVVGLTHKHGFKCFRIKQIGVGKRYFFSRQVRNAAQRLFGRIAQVIHHGDLVPCIEQLQTSVAANVPCTAGNKYVHFLSVQKVIRDCSAKLN